MPVAVQRGRSAEVSVESLGPTVTSFAGAYKVLFEGNGVTATVVPAAAGQGNPQQPIRSVTLNVTVAADAALGVREFRVATNQGISSIGQLVVVDEPVVVENGVNNTRDKANPIQLPCVVCGRIEALEDVDYFKFHAEAGQMLTFEVFCARLQDKIHDLQKHADPLVTVFDADGRELAANDDSSFADPMLTFPVPKTSDYFVQVRDSKYDGDPRWAYALLVTNRPYVSHVYPMAGNPGQTVEVEPVGSAAAAQARVPLVAPPETGLHGVP